MLDNQGTVVANGNHVVPKGVAVEELDGGKKKLSDQCPPALRELLEEKNALTEYDKLVSAIVNESNTRNVFGKWQDKEFVSILDLFRDDFADKGIQVALCKRTSGSASHRWLEFIDVEQAGNYVPQYDVANRSGQVIKTMYTTLKFPNGVAVEELKQWKGREKLQERIPIHVETMLTDKGLMAEYHALVNDVVAAGVGANSKMWNTEKLTDIIHAHRPNFRAKGVEVFLSHKQEYISHGQYGGHVEYFRWIEFVDLAKQPNYHPQRDAESKKENCVIL